MTGKPPPAPRRVRRAAALLGLLVLVPLAGCGPGQGEVSGKVTYKGKPLPGGLVTFRPADGRHNSVAVELGEDGSYKAALPTGEVTATVDNRELAGAPELALPSLAVPLSAEAKKAIGSAPRPSSRPPKRSERYVEIPEKYHDAETSGLKFTVKGGTQTHDLVLTD